jgi:hypothetical protein
MKIGNEWFGKNYDKNVRTLLVDDFNDKTERPLLYSSG